MAIKVSLTASRNHALMLRADNFFLKLLLTQILCWILRDNTKEGGEASSGRPGGIKGLWRDSLLSGGFLKHREA